VVVKWERLRRQNHWLDALYNASAAGNYCGARLVDEIQKPRRQPMTLQEMAQLSNRPNARELAEQSRSGFDIELG
jgi:hypothetical protein